MLDKGANMAKLFDRNGIRILKVEPEVALQKAAEKAAKNYIEGGIAAPLGEELKAALRAAAAERKAAKKAANVAKMAAARKKRAEALKDSAKAAQKLFAFVRGQAASLIGNFEEVVEEVYAFEATSLEVEIREIFNLLGELYDEKYYDTYVFIRQAKERGFDQALIEAVVSVYSYKREFIYSVNPRSPEEKLKEKFEKFEKNIKKEIQTILRKWGRYKTAKALGIARPDLAKHYNIDPKAFGIVDEIARKMGLDPKGAYDSEAVWGLDPRDIARAWYASGAKNHPKFRVWVKRMLQILKERGRVDEEFISTPKRNESVEEYKNRLNYEAFLQKWEYSIFGKKNYGFKIKAGDRKRLAKLPAATKFYALSHCLVDAGQLETEFDYFPVVLKAIDWQKVAEFLKLSKKQKATYLPFKLAWSFLFKRKAPAGLGSMDPHPTVLADRVTQKTFRQLMQIVKSESTDEFALEANTKAAYHLSIVFRDIKTVRRWVKAATGAETLDSIAIHDAFVDANAFMKVSNREAWAALLIQFPDLRWVIKHAPAFEAEYGRMPSGKREFENFATQQKFEDVTDKEVASIAAELGLDQDEFEDYQEFFEENPGKTSTMLPDVQVSEGEYTFRKLDDHDKRGPFLGLMTDCCQHLHNAGSSCAKAGWRDPESGFYVVEKNGNIVAQSWAWRGKEGELCFDSIEGLGNVSIEKIATLYQKAAHAFLGKLGITRVTVGDTSYGLTPDIREYLGGQECEAAEMIKSVSYTDARTQWLLASE